MKDIHKFVMGKALHRKSVISVHGYEDLEEKSLMESIEGRQTWYRSCYRDMFLKIILFMIRGWY